MAILQLSLSKEIINLYTSAKVKRKSGRIEALPLNCTERVSFAISCTAFYGLDADTVIGALTSTRAVPNRGSLLFGRIRIEYK